MFTWCWVRISRNNLRNWVESADKSVSCDSYGLSFYVDFKLFTNVSLEPVVWAKPCNRVCIYTGTVKFAVRIFASLKVVHAKRIKLIGYSAAMWVQLYILCVLWRHQKWGTKPQYTGFRKFNTNNIRRLSLLCTC